MEPLPPMNPDPPDVVVCEGCGVEMEIAHGAPHRTMCLDCRHFGDEDAYDRARDSRDERTGGC